MSEVHLNYQSWCIFLNLAVLIAIVKAFIGREMDLIEELVLVL